VVAGHRRPVLVLDLVWDQLRTWQPKPSSEERLSSRSVTCLSISG
jgi:hypothetical protein